MAQNDTSSAQNQAQGTPRIDITSILSNTAVVAGLIALVGAVYTLVTGRHLNPDQQQALQQLILALVAIAAAVAGKAAGKAKAASFRSTANVADVVAGHLEKVGEGAAAAAVQRAVGK